MTRRRMRWIKQLTAAVAAGWVFGSLSCVQNVADTVGTGLSLTSTSGVLGAGGQAANALDSELDLSADLARFTPVGH